MKTVIMAGGKGTRISSVTSDIPKPMLRVAGKPVLEHEIECLRNRDDFELIPDVASAIRKINSSGYLAVVITNQPVIARGEVTWDELHDIHNKMETLLGYEGAYLDGIYVCPHHPHNGFKGEIKELKIDCDCRKPKPGMFFSAATHFNIDLSKSWMVGDSKNDIVAGKAAGCKAALIGAENWGQDMTVSNLSEAVDKIIYTEQGGEK